MCSAMCAWVPHKVTELSILQKEGVLKCMCSSVWELFGPGKETETLREREGENQFYRPNKSTWVKGSIFRYFTPPHSLSHICDRQVCYIYVWNKHKGYIKQHNTHHALVTISITLTLREQKKTFEVWALSLRSLQVLPSKFAGFDFEVCTFWLRSLQILTSKFDVLSSKFGPLKFYVLVKILRFS